MGAIRAATEETYHCREFSGWLLLPPLRRRPRRGGLGTPVEEKPLGNVTFVVHQCWFRCSPEFHGLCVLIAPCQRPALVTPGTHGRPFRFESLVWYICAMIIKSLAMVAVLLAMTQAPVPVSGQAAGHAGADRQTPPSSTPSNAVPQSTGNPAAKDRKSTRLN